MWLILGSCLLAATVSASDVSPPQLDVLPYPQSVTMGAGSSKLDSTDFNIKIGVCNADCDVLDRAIERYSALIFQAPGSTGTTFRLSIFEDRINAPAPTGATGKLRQLTIYTNSSSTVELQLGVDESYQLEIPDGVDASNQEAAITAPTVWGALRGLETFLQIVSYQPEQAEFSVLWTPISVADAPRFPWRGVLVDSARHYLSTPLLYRMVDAMEAQKLNTLHWHISDAESFPYVSEQYPELQKKATYHPSASYSPEMIKEFVAYARDRGVRILPEFDTPGHTAAVGQAFPELIADCYDWMEQYYGIPLRWPDFDNVALDVTKPATKLFVANIMEEMVSLFPDNYFHIGGDEVNQNCWAAVPSMLTYMQENDFASFNSSSSSWTYDFTALQGSWATFVQQVTAKLNRQAVAWEESFTLGFDLAEDTIVHVWLPDTGNHVVQKAVQSGHRVLLSNGWYLDRQAPNCVDDNECKVNWMWMYTGRDMYAVEPLAPDTSGWVPTDEEAKLIIGGEAASWGESVDDKNFDARVWSRTPGVAERLWSDASNTDNWLLQARLSSFGCKLARRGVTLADVQPAFCDYYDHDL